jgi:Fe2+ transport system protein FeoA
MIPLQFLQAGEPAVVEELDGPDAAVHRLREMGLEPGAEVEMVQEGSPCIVRIGAQRLCLRFDDATTILVTISPHIRPTV